MVADRVADAVLSATNRCGLYAGCGLDWLQMVADKISHLQPFATLIKLLIYNGLDCMGWAAVAEWQIKTKTLFLGSNRGSSGIWRDIN